jgi:glutaredoxin
MLTIYSKNNCSHCTQAKDFLRKRGVAFTEIKLDEDAEAMAFIRSEGHKTVPQIYQDGKLFAAGGFIGLLNVDPDRLDQLEKETDYVS